MAAASAAKGNFRMGRTPGIDTQKNRNSRPPGPVQRKNVLRSPHRGRRFCPPVWWIGTLCAALSGPRLECVSAVRDERKSPASAWLTAAVFVASQIHIPLGPASVHLLLNGLAGRDFSAAGPSSPSPSGLTLASPALRPRRNSRHSASTRSSSGLPAVCRRVSVPNGATGSWESPPASFSASRQLEPRVGLKRPRHRLRLRPPAGPAALRHPRRERPGAGRGRRS